MVTFRALLLVIGFILAFDVTAWAQIPAVVRVVQQAEIRRWMKPAEVDILYRAEPGTELDVLDKDGDWYWVVTPRDVYGTRRAGWIEDRLVEVVVKPEEPAAVEKAVPTLPPEVSPPQPAEVVAEKPAPPAGVSRTEAAAARVRPEFDDVLFDLDRSALKPDALAILKAAATALGSDGVLRLTIEGHTCNLGTAAYNLALGHRRAAAVRDYLLSQGIPADRLHIVSIGEEQPKHDNSQESTRALNRRVVLIPRDR